MSKIRLNEEDLRRLSKIIKDENLFAVGFYGDLNKCL